MCRLYVLDDDAPILDSHVFRYFLFAFLFNRIYSRVHTALSSLPLIRLSSQNFNERFPRSTANCHFFNLVSRRKNGLYFSAVRVCVCQKVRKFINGEKK